MSYRILSIEEIKNLLRFNKSQEVLNFLLNKDYSTLKDNFLFVYGTLRKGEYNYDRVRHNFGKESFMYIASGICFAARMYDYGSYPVAVSSTSKEGRNSIEGELFFCNNNARSFIDNMEIGSGYKIRQSVIRINDEFIEVDSPNILSIDTYVATAALAKEVEELNCPLIEEGDWIEYNKSVI